MTKTLGFSAILLAALLFSVQRIEEQRRLTGALRSYCDMLEQMIGLLEIQAPPMPELLSALSCCCTGPAAEFVERLYQSMESLGTESFQALWQKSLSASAGGLDKDAQQALDSLGSVLGGHAAGDYTDIGDTMDVDLIFKIAAVGILVAVLNILLQRSGRDEQALMTTITALVVVLMVVVQKISELFHMIKALFGL